ncbi:NTP transferase domain-containing protein [Arthrobacter sp. GMC3]|uniref:nucleotidyltransferase family protein n=1 Tax=Arthrobacter sp. GMC3 TaxID=2058894 RepID=UPI000CE52E7A|nr:nucleotidyltransferase family protein [Arthrobacter sp. GMC3]
MLPNPAEDHLARFPTAAVLLAAGSGSRLGRGPKALLPFHGSTLVEHAASTLRSGGCAHTVVVVGSGAAQLQALQAAGRSTGRAFAACHLVVNEGWASGMGGSFRLGVAAVDPGHNVLVALVDQPGVTAGVIARLIAAHQDGRITAAGYLATPGSTTLLRGHPIVFSPSLATAAASLSEGDAGARMFLRAHPELIDVVDCSDLSDGADLDTPADLHLLD